MHRRINYNMRINCPNRLDQAQETIENDNSSRKGERDAGGLPRRAKVNIIQTASGGTRQPTESIDTVRVLHDHKALSDGIYTHYTQTSLSYATNLATPASIT